jgi:hypothetical protein
MAEDIARSHRRDETVDQVQVRAASGRQSDLQDHIARVQDLGVVHRLDTKIVDAVPAECAHLGFS